jgi:hypothetical protein
MRRKRRAQQDMQVKRNRPLETSFVETAAETW